MCAAARRSPDAVVIGAGIVGCAVAAELARRGRRVEIVDQGPGVASGSTSASSAIVRFHYSTLDSVALAWESGLLWPRWQEWLDLDPAEPHARFHRAGMVLIDPPGTDRTELFARFDRVGVRWEQWDAATLRRRLPALDVGRYFPPRAPDDPAFFADPHGEVSAVWQPDGGFVDDPVLAAADLLSVARRHGATVRFRTRVVGVDRAGGRVAGVRLADGSVVRAPVVVNAAGPHSGRVNDLAGITMAVRTRPLRQEVHVVPSPRGFRAEDGAPVVGDGDLGTYFRPHPGGTLVVGGIEAPCDPLVWVDDPDADLGGPTVPEWEAHTWRLARRLPDAAVPLAPVGLAALYDVSDDWAPVYDRSDLDGFYLAVGTSGNQFKNAPLVGPVLASIVDAVEAGHDHDRHPVQLNGPVGGNVIDLGTFSRNRQPLATTASVLG